MGVKKLDKYLRYVDNTTDNYKSINNVHLAKLYGSKLAIDIYIYIYQSLYSDNTNHIIGIINFIDILF